MLPLSRWPPLTAFGLLLAMLLVLPSKTIATLTVLASSDEPITRLVSVAMGGGPANGASIVPALSADGRYVAFTSSATNLVLNDTNERTDVFVRDMVEGTTVRVSVASDGIQGNGASQGAAISRDGRFVAFSSTATNLVLSDTNKLSDVFVHDLQEGTTTRVSMGLGGVEADGDSRTPSISGNGAFVAFISGATNLVTDDEPGEDMFMTNLTNGLTERVSDNFTERKRGIAFTLRSPALSESGRLVVFTGLRGWTDAGPPVCVMRVHDRQMQTNASRNCGQTSAPATISGNGVFVAFAECINNEFGRAFLSCFASGGLDVVNLMDSTTSQADWT